METDTRADRTVGTPLFQLEGTSALVMGDGDSPIHGDTLVDVLVDLFLSQE